MPPRTAIPTIRGQRVNHVLLHQTVIGQEAKIADGPGDDEPDVVIGCFGGGKHFGGIALPMCGQAEGIGGAAAGGRASACPSLTRGAYAYDFGDLAKLTPLSKMYTLGHDFVPPAYTPAACATTGHLH